MSEGQAVPGSATIVRLYGWAGSETLRSYLRGLLLRWEGGPGYSLTLRAIARRYHRLEIGLYSTWPCGRKPAVFHPGTRVGRYACIADTVRTFTRNHPMNLISTHGLFYNPALGRVKGAPLEFNTLTIGNGARLGHNVVILPPAAEIGEGAFVAPGSVICSNIPPYALVSGFPAVVKGFRFDREMIARLLASRWWEKPPAALDSCRDLFRPVS